MKRLALIFAFITLCAGLGYSQDLTWSELKAVQKEARQEVFAKQKEELQSLSDIQKLQLDTLLQTTPSQDRVTELAKAQASERAELNTKHIEERKRLIQEQSVERKEFAARRNAGSAKTP